MIKEFMLITGKSTPAIENSHDRFGISLSKLNNLLVAVQISLPHWFLVC